MSPSTLEYLHHILDETQYLVNQTKDLSKAKFMRDETLQRAFVRSLEIIGGAVKQLPDDLTSKYSQIEWRAIAGMRNKLIHDYFGVDYDLVWDALISKIPQLQREITQIIRDEESNS
jgi:uncharacterized protein with HEPN domain